MSKQTKRSSSDNPILDMSALKTAIVNNEENRVKEILRQGQIDSLQQSYLAELAVTSNNQRLADYIKSLPSKP